MADLKGRRVGFVEVSPSILMNTEAALAFAGLTVADVEQVMYPGYGALLSAFVVGEVEVVPAVTTSASLREAEAGRGVRWLDMPAEDTEGWARATESSSLFSPIAMTSGVSISEADPAHLLGYRYPQLSTLASASEEEVYNLLKALDQTIDGYKDVSSVMPNWAMATAGTTPAAAPFHSGAVKYLREIGVWDADDEAWNNARLLRLQTVIAAWPEALAAAEAQGVSDSDWPAFWTEFRDAKLAQ